MLLILLLISLIWLVVLAIVMAVCQSAARADGRELELEQRLYARARQPRPRGSRSASLIPR